jgi:polysaccharide pyruvyl transferase WcaK-like protein
MLEILKDNFQGTYYMYWLDFSIPNFTQKINVTFLNKPRNLMQCFKLLKILLSIDFIVVAGGQKYRWPLKSGLAPQFIIPLLARMLGKPLFFFSIGIEPNNDPLWAKFIKDISEAATFISVRDRSSFNYLIKLGVKKAFLSKDVVFYYIKNHENEIELLKLLKRNKAERKVVGLAIRCSEISRDILEYYIPRLIEELLNNNYHLLFLPATDGDLNLLKGYLTSLSPPLRHKITLVESTEPKVLIKSIAYSDVLISLRLHFFTFCISNGYSNSWNRLSRKG